MFETGSENGEEMGIGLFKGRCEKFSDKIEIKLPHIGFNLVNHPNSRIWRDIPTILHFILFILTELLMIKKL